MGVVSMYQAWDSAYRDFHTEAVQRLLDEKRVPMITWEPWKLPCDIAEGSAPQDQPEFSLSHITEGRFDAYIDEWAKQIKSLKRGPVLLRPMHEMNGNWYPWCGSVNGNKPASYVAAWRHIVLRFQHLNCSNVQWIWSPYIRSYPTTPANHMRRYYPGDDFVDAIALDGFNWGVKRPEIGWKSFENIFKRASSSISKFSSRPVFIGETAAPEEGGDKSAWISQAFDTLRKQNSLAGLVWFNANKECDWRIDSSQTALHAFRQAVRQISRNGVNV